MLHKFSNDELVEKMAETMCDRMCRFSNSHLPEEVLNGICDECDLDLFFIEVNNRLNEKRKKKAKKKEK